MAEKKYTKRELDEYVKKMLCESEITLSRQKERIEELKKENQRLSAELENYKRKDKASARALTLSERKNKYIQEVTKSRCAIEIDRLTRLSERYSELFDSLEYNEQKKLEQFNQELKLTISTLENLGEYIEQRKPLSDAEKNYISEKKRISLDSAVKSDLDERFNKLVAEFRLKIGNSATRGRGRPKKSEQSILVEVNKTGNSATATTDKETEEVIEKINELFYGTNTPTAPAVTKKKKSADVFDLDEALNPDLSLAEIMKEIKK